MFDPPVVEALMLGGWSAVAMRDVTGNTKSTFREAVRR
jgi:hypothetical protein